MGVTSAGDYVARLRDGHVMDWASRGCGRIACAKTPVVEMAASLATEKGVSLRHDQRLLDEMPVDVAQPALWRD